MKERVFCWRGTPRRQDKRIWENIPKNWWGLGRGFLLGVWLILRKECVEKGGEVGLGEGDGGQPLEVTGVHPGVDDFSGEAFEGEVSEEPSDDRAVQECSALLIDLVALF